MPFSRHANNKHQDEPWNSKTIKAALDAGKLSRVTICPGATSDVIYGFTQDGTCVGLIVGKNGIIVTGFAADEEYWQSV